MIKRDLWLWRGMHLAFAAAIPLLLVLLVGCLPKAKEAKEDLGPAIPDEQIDEALSKAISGYTFQYIHVGQFVSYQMTRRLENQETTTNLGNLDVRVKARTENEEDNSVTFTLRAERNVRNGNGGFDPPIVTEEPLKLYYGSSMLTDALNHGVSQQRVSTMSLRQEMGALEEKLPVTYHHLKTYSKMVDPPQAVRETPDCGGIQGCQLKANFIQFEMVIWKSESSYQKVSLDFAFSTDMPFLPFGENFDQFNGVMIMDCRSTYVPIEKRTVYVRDCLNVDNFRRNELK